MGLTLLPAGMPVTVILLSFFFLPFQEDETDVSEEVKAAWVSNQQGGCPCRAQRPRRSHPGSRAHS